MTIGIYKITNKKTGQIYIGQSINIERRFQEHISGQGCPSSYIDNAIQKYGENHFEFKIIEEFDKNTPFLNDVLNDSEQYYIAAYNTFKNNFHYNLTIGGDGLGSSENHPCYGKPLSEEHKKKISKAQSGKHLSEETKKKISKKTSGENNPNYGKKHSEETKKKMSENHWDNSGENHPFFGKHHSEESKKKLSEANSGANNPVWKNYARIIKAGKYNNQQKYAIRYQGKIIKQSISIDKLSKWFSENYPNEELKFEKY